MSASHNPDGSFAKGNKLSPGRPPGIIHTLKDRQNRFLEELTRGEILALAADEHRLNTEYRAFDAQVILGLAETLMQTPETKLDPRSARNDLYDRNLGKASQPVQADIIVTHQIDKSELARRLAFMLAEQKTIEGKASLVDGVDNDTALLPSARPESA